MVKTSSSSSSSSILSHPAASTISSPLLVVASTPANFPANSRTKKLVLFLLSSSVSVKFSRFSLLAFSDWSFFSCPRIRLHQRCSRAFLRRLESTQRRVRKVHLFVLSPITLGNVQVCNCSSNFVLNFSFYTRHAGSSIGRRVVVFVRTVIVIASSPVI